MLTTQWRDGLRLEDFARTATQDARDRAGEALYEFYIGTLYRHGLFNADPHPGNLLFGDDGSVVILDHGCVREFDRGTVACVARLSKAVREDRREGIMAALRGLEARPPEDDKAFETTRRLLRGFFQPTLESGPRPMRGDVTFEARQLVADKRALLKSGCQGGCCSCSGSGSGSIRSWRGLVRCGIGGRWRSDSRSRCSPALARPRGGDHRNVLLITARSIREKGGRSCQLLVHWGRTRRPSGPREAGQVAPPAWCITIRMPILGPGERVGRPCRAPLPHRPRPGSSGPAPPPSGPATGSSPCSSTSSCRRTALRCRKSQSRRACSSPRAAAPRSRGST